MNLPSPKPWGAILFALVVALFILFGPGVGWRAAGLWQLTFSIQIFLKPEIPVGIEGSDETLFTVRGPAAVLIGILNLGFVVMLVFFPEETVMRGGQ